MQPETNQPLFLLIDDNEIDLFFHEKLLAIKQISTRVKSFISASDALDFLEYYQDKPQEYCDTVILLDIQMPEIDGFGFLDRFELFSEEILAKTRIFLVSSSLDHGDLSRGYAHHLVSGILKKPLNAEELIKSLRDSEWNPPASG